MSHYTFILWQRLCLQFLCGFEFLYLNKTNTRIAKELKITPILDKLLEYKRNWIQHVNRMPRNRLPKVMKHYSPTGKKSHGRPLKRLLDTWDRNGSTSGPTPWQIYDDDDDDDDVLVFKRMFYTDVFHTYGSMEIIKNEMRWGGAIH